MTVLFPNLIPIMKPQFSYDYFSLKLEGLIWQIVFNFFPNDQIDSIRLSIGDYSEFHEAYSLPVTLAVDRFPLLLLSLVQPIDELIVC